MRKKNGIRKAFKHEPVNHHDLTNNILFRSDHDNIYDNNNYYNYDDNNNHAATHS